MGKQKVIVGKETVSRKTSDAKLEESEVYLTGHGNLLKMLEEAMTG